MKSLLAMLALAGALSSGSTDTGLPYDAGQLSDQETVTVTEVEYTDEVPELEIDLSALDL